jgi:predicted dehydrogenase
MDAVVDSSSRPVTVALLGCGLVSRSHLPAFRAARSVDLRVVADLDSSRAQAAAAAAGDVAWSADPDAVLADPAIEAVAVCLPHYLHADVAIAALSLGKHVFVEKPMALRLEDCARMIAAAEAGERILAVGHVIRCWNAVRLARDAVAAGEIGRHVHTIRRRYLKRGSETEQLEWARSEATSGGLLYGNGSHEVDSVLWMLGERPLEVSARAGTLGDESRGASEIALSIALSGGGFYTLTMSRGTAQSVWDQWTVGADGSLHLAGQDLAVNGERRGVPAQPERGFLDEWEIFGAAVRSGDAAHALSARSVWPTMVALECARESIRSGKPVDARDVDRWELYDG